MACRPLKSVYFEGFLNRGDLLVALEEELEVLAEIASETDFGDDDQRTQFQRNVTFIKGYFERYERIVKSESSQ